MKRVFKVVIALSGFLFVLTSTVIPQETSLCDLIGKSTGNVIKKFGNPLHQDKSNPAMQCIYYQSKSSRMAFIADNAGVYQIQADYYYDSKSAADNAINRFVTKCYKDSMQVDTVNVKEFKIYGSGLRASLTLFENNFSKKYEVKLQADRSENK